MYNRLTSTNANKKKLKLYFNAIVHSNSRSRGSFQLRLLAVSVTLLRFVVVAGNHRCDGDPGRPIGVPRLRHELLEVLGRVHVHLAPHEVDGEVRGDAAAHEVEAADAGAAVRAGEFALGPTALEEYILSTMK